MKKLFLLLISAFILTSCDVYYCDDDFDGPHTTKWQGNDYFYADRLIGTWQCCYPMLVGSVEFKQIRFMRDGYADITMAYNRDTDWFTETYRYTYYGKTIRFEKNGQVVSFTIYSFLSPELTVYDSLGRYIWRYVRAE